MSRSTTRAALLLAVPILIALVIAAPALAKGPPASEGLVNNQSFPVIAVDGFAITPVIESLTVPYSGTYPGLTAEEIADRITTGPWYPQKTQPYNQWRADSTIATAADVTFVDWGDNIESVYPKLRRPFRLEVTLYQALSTPMQGYVMALLEYPSSPDELQGTNGMRYESDFASVISNSPRLVVQYLGTTMPATELIWNGSAWSEGTVVPVSFAPELNVGGKYIYGASQGGWKPTALGFYRITFFVPAGGVSLASAVIGNYGDYSAPAALESDEGGAATPIVRGDLNLTYVDVEVLGGGGGGKRQ